MWVSFIAWIYLKFLQKSFFFTTEIIQINLLNYVKWLMGKTCQLNSEAHQPNSLYNSMKLLVSILLINITLLQIIVCSNLCSQFGASPTRWIVKTVGLLAYMKCTDLKPNKKGESCDTALFLHSLNLSHSFKASVLTNCKKSQANSYWCEATAFTNGAVSNSSLITAINASGALTGPFHSKCPRLPVSVNTM